MVNREDCGGQSINKRMFLKSTLFTGSEPIHSYDLDFFQGIFFPRELRESERILTTQSPNSTDPGSLVIITKRIAYIINSENSYTGTDIMKDLNNIEIPSVSDMHLYVHRVAHSIKYLNESLVRKRGHPMSIQFMKFFQSASAYMIMRWKEDHEYYIHMMERSTQLNINDTNCYQAIPRRVLPINRRWKLFILLWWNIHSLQWQY